VGRKILLRFLYILSLPHIQTYQGTKDFTLEENRGFTYFLVRHLNSLDFESNRLKGKHCTAQTKHEKM